MRILIFLSSFFFLSVNTFSQKKDFKVIAYYSGDASKIDMFDVSQLTHIIHSFSHLKENKLDVGNEKSIVAIRKLVDLKKAYPNLKVMLSLGGWTGCYTCSDIFSSSENRRAFAKSVKEALVRFGADGIDLDWEYPAIEGPPGHPFKDGDRENFTALVRELRKTLGKRYIISFAAGGFDTYFQDAVEWKKVSRKVDFINLMSYDLVNGYSTVTGHHTPLYSTNENLFSVDYGVNQMKKRGVPSKKIIAGIAFYGRVWQHTKNSNNGLYQDAEFKKMSSFGEIEKLKDSADYVFYWDDTAKAPFVFNKKEGLFITYDNRRSVGLKTRYSIEHKLGGVMFWELILDNTEEGLLNEITKELRKEER